MKNLHLDFETYCDFDLKKVGSRQYIAHPSFKVLAVAWKLDGQATKSYYLTASHMLPSELAMTLTRPDVQVHAWNAAFETTVLQRLQLVPAHPLSCTMQRALAYGLPAKLERAAEALGLRQRKDMHGHRLMLKMSRPLKEGQPAWTPADYTRLADYCAGDVAAEAAASEVIPELMPEERELAQLDAHMNNSGELGIDFDRVMALGIVAKAAEKLDAERCSELTGGAVTSPGTQTARLLSWLGEAGIDLPDVARATVEEALTETLWSPQSGVKEVLDIRLRAARASTRKLSRMLDMSDLNDGALRGQFQFCGAGRTGRWSGRGVQVQNLPRVPKGFDPDLFYDLAARAAKHENPARLARFDMITPAPVLDCVSWSLRSCLKATNDDKYLWSFDFSQIEARVLAWLAGQRDVLAVFASGEDVYVWAAQQFGSSDRQLGKVLVLALGFGMGAVKLRETARKNYGVQMTAAEADRFKTEWRARNPRIVTFWAEMEIAARKAVLQRSVQAVGGSGIAFVCTSRTLQLRLPSGRVLYYHQPRIDPDTGSLSYWGAEVGGKWVEQRTWGGKLAENATQAAARDIMAEAMLRAWRRLGQVPCMSVHDELVYAVPDTGGLQELYAIMLEPPPWAGGLPLAGEFKVAQRYGVPIPLGKSAQKRMIMVPA